MSTRSLLTMIIGVAAIATIGCNDKEPRYTWAPIPGSPPSARQSGKMFTPPEVSIAPSRNPSLDVSVRISEGSETLEATNATLAHLIALAYRTPEANDEIVPSLSTMRVVSSEPLPAGAYDVSIRIRNGNAALMREQLRELLSREFDITAHAERRASEVLVLGRATGAVPPAPGPNPPLTPGTRRVTFTGSSIYLLAEELEGGLRVPVVAEARLRGQYKVFIEQAASDNSSAPLDLEATRQALRSQLGLDLVAGQRSVEYVVVD